MLLLEALFNIAKAGMPIIILIIVWFYLQVVLARDKNQGKKCGNITAISEKKKEDGFKKKNLKQCVSNIPKFFILMITVLFQDKFLIKFDERIEVNDISTIQ